MSDYEILQLIRQLTPANQLFGSVYDLRLY